MTDDPNHHFFYSDGPIYQDHLAGTYDEKGRGVQVEINRNVESMRLNEIAINQLDQQAAELRAQGFSDEDREIQDLASKRQSILSGLRYLRDVLHPALLSNLQIFQTLATDARNRARKARIRAGMQVPALTTPPPTVDPDAAIISRTM